jgi:hypothetical protein
MRTMEADFIHKSCLRNPSIDINHQIFNRFPRQPKTSVPSALARRALARVARSCITRARNFTVSFLSSCCKVEILPAAMAPAVNLFTAKNLQTKTSLCVTRHPGFCPWPMLALAPTGTCVKKAKKERSNE